MASWRSQGGVDWLGPDRGSGRPELVELGVAFAHGYADETPAGLGIGAAAATALARELARPRELSGHRLEQAQVGVEVGLQLIAVLVSGDPETVHRAGQALEETLRDPSALESGAPAPLPFGWHGWPDEKPYVKPPRSGWPGRVATRGGFRGCRGCCLASSAR